MILSIQGDDAAVIGDFYSLLVLTPDDTIALNGACWSRGVVNKELDTALAQCRHALAIRPQSAAALDSLGFVQFRRGDLAGALASYDAALSLAPQQAPSLFMRGIVKLRLGKTADGEADVAAAQALDSGVSNTYKRYGVSR